MNVLSHQNADQANSATLVNNTTIPFLFEKIFEFVNGHPMHEEALKRLDTKV